MQSNVPVKAPADPNPQAFNFRDALILEIPHLRAFALSLSNNATKADDLMQDTLLKAWANSKTFEPGSNLRAWLFTILRNTYFSAYRRRGREVQDTEGYYSARIGVPAEQEGAIDLADFRVALAKLPDEQREAVTLVGASGLSYEEAAEVCGVAIGTIKSRVNRARTRLAQLLGISDSSDLGQGRVADAVVRKHAGGAFRT
jgi:RNA polymerase sigma-70 factor, ECF subfamily